MFLAEVVDVAEISSLRLRSTFRPTPPFELILSLLLRSLYASALLSLRTPNDPHRRATRCVDRPCSSAHMQVRFQGSCDGVMVVGCVCLKFDWLSGAFGSINDVLGPSSDHPLVHRSSMRRAEGVGKHSLDRFGQL